MVFSYSSFIILCHLLCEQLQPKLPVEFLTPWISPLPGMTKLGRLKENIAPRNIDLTSKDLQQINETASKIQIMGNRYLEALEKLTGL